MQNHLNCKFLFSNWLISLLLELITIQFPFQATRLGKHINELRRKAHDEQLASRAKSLVKKWRKLLMPGPASGSATPVQTASKSAAENAKNVAANAVQRLQQQQQHTQLNGHHSSQPSSRLTSPAVSSSSRLSPGLTSAVNSNNAAAAIANQRLQSVPNQPSVVNVNHNSSSLPSSASSSPGLSRPTTPSLGSRPVSPAVPKTHVANKRLRKELEPEFSESPPHPASKRAKLQNGESATTPQCDPGSLVNGLPKTAAVNVTTTNTRKKKQELERERLLEEKIITAKRQASKVRTTQELVQELALRSTTSPALQRPQSRQQNANSGSVVSSSAASQIVSDMPKTELMNRFFESQTAAANANGHSVLSPPLSDGAPSPEEDQLDNAVINGTSAASNGTPNFQNTNRETVEDVLAQLPPIDVATVLAEINSEMQDDDDDDDVEIEGLIPVKKPEPLTESLNQELVQELHTGKHEGVNGNFTHDGAFKEWHEVVSKETLHGDLLYILPYSVID